MIDVPILNALFVLGVSAALLYGGSRGVGSSRSDGSSKQKKPAKKTSKNGKPKAK